MTGPGYYEQGDFATEYGSPKCIVKLGCWGPVVKCNVPKRGWINGVGGCPERRRHLHRLHHAGLPGQVHAVHGRAARRARLDAWRAASTAALVREPAATSPHQTVDEEPKWRAPGSKLLTGYKGEWR